MQRRLTKMEKRRIEDRVLTILKEVEYDVKNDTYIDAVNLAKKYGFIVGETDKLPEGEDGFIILTPDESVKVIGVNNNRSREDKRFIVMHELAHYFLHNKQLREQVMHREHKRGRNNYENDADYFAACMLMPVESFKKESKKLDDEGISGVEKIIKLQKIFQTSYESVKRRLEEVAWVNNVLLKMKTHIIKKS